MKNFERSLDHQIDQLGDALGKGTGAYFSGIGKGVINLKNQPKLRKRFLVTLLFLIAAAAALEIFVQWKGFDEYRYLQILYRIKYLPFPVALISFLLLIGLVLYTYGNATDKMQLKFQSAFRNCGLYSQNISQDSRGKEQKHQILPYLISERTDRDGGTIYLFKNVGIPISRWLAAKETLESQLEQIIAYIENPKKNLGLIEIKIGGAAMQDFIPFKEDMIENLKYPTVYIGHEKDTPILHNFSKVPHLLVAGGTGSGKSVVARFAAYQGIKVLDGLLYAIDFKGGLEFAPFEKIGVPVCWESRDAARLMNQLVMEMKARLLLFREKGVKNIDELNEKYPKTPLKRCFVVVDELAELLDYKGVPEEEQPYFQFIDASLKSLARLARAPGIHLILATQYPTSDIVNGQIKQNVTGRICGFFKQKNAYQVILGHQDINLDNVQGRFIYTWGNKDYEIQAPFFKDEDIDYSLKMDYSSGLLVAAEDVELGFEDEIPSVPSRVAKKLDVFDEI